MLRDCSKSDIYHSRCAEVCEEENVNDWHIMSGKAQRGLWEWTLAEGTLKGAHLGQVSTLWGFEKQSPRNGIKELTTADGFPVI